MLSSDAILIRAITVRPSLSPASFTRTSFPIRAYPVSLLCVLDGLGHPLTPEMHHLRWEPRAFLNLISRLLATACQSLWLSVIYDAAGFHLVVARTIPT